ncbi:hypothetical protein [Nocardia sp. NPDC127526]|uniref:hypothetical protein n=1 Tax=Nocardia sp. NPDC127526 TaxID=3345393 RepID=UPI00362B8E32
MDFTKLFNEIMDNPVARRAVRTGNDLRDAALHTQDAMLDLLNMATANEVSRLAGQVKSMLRRLEQLEDTVDRLEATPPRANTPARRTRKDAQ